MPKFIMLTELLPIDILFKVHQYRLIAIVFN